MKILSVFGTRPEALKMAPLVALLAKTPGVTSVVCSTGQHQSMLEQVLELFGIQVAHNLGLMVPNQTLNDLCSRMLKAIDPVLEAEKPDRILVHGDTSTAMICALAAFHHRIPIGHVEAGLRTHDLSQPWPEEMNRRVVDIVSDLLFAPTQIAKQNLLRENLAGRIVVTGNTVIDSLRQTAEKIDTNTVLKAALDLQLPLLAEGQKLLLVTGHRRENFGSGFENICNALAKISERTDIQVVYPVHLNPKVRGPVEQKLGNLPNVHLIAPLDYLHFVRIMQRADVILTDSGGVQEEAPSLGKPVLVMREVTERPEAVAAGTVELVGTQTERIQAAVHRLMDDSDGSRTKVTVSNPYGDGHASQRIVASILQRPFEEFSG